MAIVNILIKKASGETERYSAQKLERSLINAGANIDLAHEIIQDVESLLTEGFTTKLIYKRAFKILQQRNPESKLRYQLKQAIFEMGPTGYPFEVLMGELFAKLGYSVEVGQVLQGTCLTHEMDVIATKAPIQHLMECKYHKDQGKQVSVQVPLYVRSRVNDIIDYRKVLPEFSGFEFVGWVVTNTHFSNDSISYGTGSGLKLLSWSFPQGNGIKEMLERERIFPITMVSKLTHKEKQTLMLQGIVSCQSLLANLEQVATEMQFTRQKISAVSKELKHLI